jgi:hypothetical protein
MAGRGGQREGLSIGAARRTGQRRGVGVSLRALAWISGVYDLALAIPMLTLAPTLARVFGAPPPSPLINAQLNGVFTLALGCGYFWAAGDVQARRGYLWVAGVLAKGLGATLFIWDHFTQASPASFLLFAASDGGLAVLTLALLLRRADQ